MATTHILLAEDNLEHQELLQLALEAGRDASVTTVRERDEFIRAIADQTFDCIILDFNLADCRATDLLRLLSESSQTCPALVISSSRAQETVIQSLRNGSVDFVPKADAFQGDVLWGRIDHALSERRKAQSERRRMSRRIKRLSQLAETDPLTGLANRLRLDRLMHDRRDRLDRRGSLSLCMLDLDRFKVLNDTHGHVFGDQVLREVGRLIEETCTGADIACRWGGEEFLVVKPATSLPEAVVWADRLRKAVRRISLVHEGKQVGVTVSIGVASEEDAHLRRELIQRADEALYLAKRSGRDRVCTHDMVRFLDTLDGLGLDDAGSVEQRLGVLLTRQEADLGETQFDHLTSHAEYVSRLAAWMAPICGMSDEEADRVRIAGLLHDIGKMNVPEDLLAKKAPLTGEERVFLGRHAPDGADMALLLGLDERTSDYIRYHHARYDRQSDITPPVGEPIPLGARIISVADALVSMTSHRPYRRARSFTMATQELRRSAGTQFDPRVVDAVPKALLSRAPGELRT